MTTRYVHRLAIWTPQADWAGANALAACFGESGASNLQTFRAARVTREGVQYAFASTSVTDNVRMALLAHSAGQPVLQRPAWDAEQVVDMVAAGNVLAGALVLLSFDQGNAPAYNGQTIIALNCDRAAIESAYDFNTFDGE